MAILSGKKLLFEELTFDLTGRVVAAKRWGNKKGMPVIALHGWMDNANTFDPLAPLLPELDLVAMDFAGHGLSDHRRWDSMYLTIAHVQDVLLVAEKLGWSEFNIMAHSMGANISYLLAGIFPEKINKLICLDGMTTYMETEKSIQFMRAEIESVLSRKAGKLKYFSSLDDMARRVTEATDHEKNTARMLVERGHKNTDKGFTWRTDPRLRKRGGVGFSMEQLVFMTSQITADVLLLTATKGNKWFSDSLEKIVPINKKIQLIEIEGHHHVHMSDPDKVAEIIRPFLALPDNLNQRKLNE